MPDSSGPGHDRLAPIFAPRSVAVVGASSFAISMLSLIGVGQAEAFQLLFNASGVFYALTYVVMFAIPLFGLRGITPRPPRWLQVASLSGLVMTLLYIGFALFPIIRVESALMFGIKIALVVVLMNLVGYAILRSASRAAAAEVR